KRMVADIRAGREPDPAPGIIGKQRSVHNTYFTLPVLFVMISNHYPMTYSNPYGWVVLAVIMLAGVLVRQFFRLRDKRNIKPILPALAVVLILGVAVALAPAPVAKTNETVSFAKVKGIVDTRCLACHSAQPTQPGFVQPPKGIAFDTAEQIAQNAAKIAETVG